MSKAIFLFTRDLRLEYNQALTLACKDYDVLPIFIYDESFFCKPLGSASKVWLHHSLNDLKVQCPELSFYQGVFSDVVDTLIKSFDIHTVFMSEAFFPHERHAQQALKSHLKNQSCDFHAINTSLLWHPADIKKQDDTPYKVFTPYYRRGCMAAEEPYLPETLLNPKFITDPNSHSLDSLNLLPKISWDKPMLTYWDISKEGAKNCLDAFLTKGVKSYKEGRNFPALNSVSRLSPYLHFGNISVHYIWHQVQKLTQDANSAHFLSELGWREFSYSLLHYFPSMVTQNLQPKFNDFPWQFNQTYFDAWTKGHTGYPIVDAGMRELWQTGYMHNRVRMIVGSFLVKNLLIDWRYGETWFWDCLFDADLANNTASWQWVAGSGADAAPYFRIFNPIMQGQKFDPDGEYTCRFLPELARLPKKYLFSPWEAPPEILDLAGVVLGKNYPRPIVDLSLSRDRALEAFQTLKKES
jgi:deoxyribodipyrimidine photo-lyase